MCADVSALDIGVSKSPAVAAGVCTCPHCRDQSTRSCGPHFAETSLLVSSSDRPTLDFVKGDFVRGTVGVHPPRNRDDLTITLTFSATPTPPVNMYPSDIPTRAVANGDPLRGSVDMHPPLSLDDTPSTAADRVERSWRCVRCHFTGNEGSHLLTCMNCNTCAFCLLQAEEQHGGLHHLGSCVERIRQALFTGSLSAIGVYSDTPFFESVCMQLLDGFKQHDRYSMAIQYVLAKRRICVRDLVESLRDSDGAVDLTIASKQAGVRIAWSRVGHMMQFNVLIVMCVCDGFGVVLCMWLHGGA
jgi:hypothetical protein